MPIASLKDDVGTERLFKNEEEEALNSREFP